MVFSSTLTLLTSLFFLNFFQAYVLNLRVSVTLGLRLGLGFIFYIYFVFTKPTALPSCILLSRHRWRTNKFSNFKIHRCIYSHCQFTKLPCVCLRLNIVASFPLPKLLSHHCIKRRDNCVHHYGHLHMIYFISLRKGVFVTNCMDKSDLIYPFYLGSGYRSAGRPSLKNIVCLPLIM